MNPFNALGLSQEIVDTLAEQNFEKPTPIQTFAIPKIMAGHDLLAIAQTGTGKTAAFALPSIERLKKYSNTSASPAMHPVRMLVLTPTRELADQIYTNIKSYTAKLPINHTVVYGGVSITQQIGELRSGKEIVIATVGRLLDLINQKAIQLSKVDIFILDEADRMLDMGFIEDIRKIITFLPEKKQILLFTATLSKEIERLSKEFMSNPQYIEIEPQNSASKSVEQHILAVDSFNKNKLLSQIISHLKITQVIVFCNKKSSVEQVSTYLNKNNISALPIHGDKIQKTRTETLQSFKNGEITVLVATDVAARGLDISELPFVINYELPGHPEDYVHRIGRTGRAGAEGIALSLVDESERKQLDGILKLIKQELPIEKIEGYEPNWDATSHSSSEKIITHKSTEQKRSKINSSKTKIHKTRPIQKENIFCSKIPGRRRNYRRKEVCALLLPNYGIINAVSDD